jgi:hypothetical protein
MKSLQGVEEPTAMPQQDDDLMLQQEEEEQK